MDENEPLDKAAARELQEETSVDPRDVLLTQVSIFKDRSPLTPCVAEGTSSKGGRTVRTSQQTRPQAYDSSWTVSHAGCLAANQRIMCSLLISCCLDAHADILSPADVEHAQAR